MRWRAAIIVVLGLQSAAGAQATRADLAFFESKVRPLLANRCFSCHSAQTKKTKGGLALDSRAAILRGGDSGPAAVAGAPEQSLLLRAISYGDAELAMPPQGKLPDHEAAVLREWVRRGLPFPDSQALAPPQTSIDIAAGRKFWSFRPLARPPLPVVQRSDWVQRRSDAFVLAELETRKLTPTSAAEPRVLLRRLYFDLIGLPPTPAETAAFLAECDSPDGLRAAPEKVVDRLLASPHHGERWARYWLDLARYCDIPEPWSENKGKPHLYRDWVVQALNADLPYDQFVVKQLAADQEPNSELADRAALGFLGLSPSYWKELKLAPDVIKTVVAEEWEERIHTVGSTFLGLTISCARCHDHKYDPITVQDYYGLAGVFANTRLADRATAVQYDLLADFRLPPVTQPALDSYLQAARLQVRQQQAPVMVPAVDDAALHVVADGPHRTKLVYKAAEAIDIAVQIRGNPSNLGPVVPRRFPAVLSMEASSRFAQGSGRLELARSIVTDAAPLTARVIVNRIWRHHFGAGIVETPSDFGSQGERPTHPELLDDLAARFIDNGWSLKWLHREIVLSAAYQQASTPNPAGAAIDPENRFLWRMHKRRLEVEAWRDALLAAAGTLDRRLGGAAQELNDPKNQRRTLYGTIKRRELNDLLRLHDFPDPTTHSPARVPTTTPLQQLFAMNSPLMAQQAAALVERLRGERHDERGRVQLAYQRLFQRLPSERELQLGLEFLGSDSAAAWPAYAQALLSSNEFLFVD